MDVPASPPASPERSLALAGAVGSAVAAVVVGAVGAVAGVEVGVAAAVGAGIPGVLVLASLPFLMAGGLLGRTTPVVGASLVAISFRLVLAFALLVVVDRLTDLPMTPVALGLAAGLVGSVAAEMRRATTDPDLLELDRAAAEARRRRTEEWADKRQADASSTTLLTRSSGPAYLPPAGSRRPRHR